MKMIKLTVNEYATNNQVSRQQVYKLINSGKLDVYEQNGTKYIIIDDTEQYKQMLTECQQTVKSLQREIELQKQLIDSLQFQQSLFTRLLPHTAETIKNMESVEVTDSLQKKDKKKKKKKKKK
jgi:predicted DNA-binding protein YlxM (UPF0122 family)